jgi:di/tricarboxylate transporter
VLPLSAADSAGHVFALTDSVRFTASFAVLFFGLLLARPAPLWLISLLPFAALPAFGAVSLSGLWEAVSSEYLLSLVFALFMAAGIRRWKLDRRAALLFFELTGPEPRTILAVTVMLTGFCALWTPSSLFCVLALPVLLSFGQYAEDFYRKTGGGSSRNLLKALALAVSFSVAAGAMANIAASPINRALFVFSETAEGAHIRVTAWFGICLALFCAGLPAAYFALRGLAGGRKRTQEEVWALETQYRQFLAEKSAELGAAGGKEIFLHILVGLSALGWTLSFVLQFMVGRGGFTDVFSPALITGAAAAVMLVLRLTEGDLAGAIRSADLRSQPWQAAVFFAGCLALACGLERSGAMSAAGFAVAGLLASHAVPKVLAAFLFMLALGNLLPAGAVAWLGKVLFAAALVPLGAGEGQAEVTLTLLPAATFLLPLGALHCMVLYSAGLFTFRDYFRCGVRIALVIVPLMIALPFVTDYSRQAAPGEAAAVGRGAGGAHTGSFCSLQTMNAGSRALSGSGPS